ncbi:MAG: hypothetical protein WCJ30_06785 [Deltaproteobacteria bacterium]
MIVVGALAGCAPDLCGRPAPCPNDTPPTQADRDQCRATLQANSTSACYNEMLSYANCAAENNVCGGDGHTDSALTATRVNNNCSNQLGTAVACCTRNPAASACH